MIPKVFDGMRHFLSFMASFTWLKDVLPIPVIKLTRRLRMKVWKNGAYKVLREQQRREGREVLHFLHIGKTGGTAIKAALEGNLETKSFHVLVTPHPFTLRDVPLGDKFTFVLRDPVSRFVSGFNNRQLEGRPSYVQPWTRRERVSFSEFPSANELALGLYSRDSKLRKKARRAMISIEHVNTSYDYWLGSVDYLRSRRNDLIFVSFQESLNEDFKKLVETLELPDSVKLPRKASEANRTDGKLNSRLEGTAVKNLTKWYALDYEIYKYCKTIRQEKIPPSLGVRGST